MPDSMLNASSSPIGQKSFQQQAQPRINRLLAAVAATETRDISMTGCACVFMRGRTEAGYRRIRYGATLVGGVHESSKTAQNLEEHAAFQFAARRNAAEFRMSAEQVLPCERAFQARARLPPDAGIDGAITRHCPGRQRADAAHHDTEFALPGHVPRRPPHP